MAAVLRYALARLSVRRGRTLLSALGIAAAGAMLGAAVIVADGLGGGFDRTASRANLADVIATFQYVQRADVERAVGALANIRAVSYRLESTSVALQAGGRFDDHITIEGLGPGPHGYAVVAGRDLQSDGEVVIEAGLARAWHLQLGQTVTIGDFERRSGRFRIVGAAVTPDTVAFPLAKHPRVFIGYDDARRLTGAAPGLVNGVQVWLRDPRLVDVTLAQARSASFGLSGLQFVTRTGLRLLIGRAAGIVVAVLVAFSLVALVVAGTMLAASAGAEVQRRLEAFGLLRAVGVSRRELILGSAVEAAAVALPAGALGLAVGWLAVRGPTARLLASINEVPPGASSVWLLLAGLAGLVALVAGASAWPAWRATRRPAVVLLRGADVVTWTRRLRLPAGTASTGLRLVLGRPARTAATVVVLALAAAVVLVILTVASFLQSLDRQPTAVGKRYQLLVSAPAARAAEIARLPGVAAAAPRYEIAVADSFQLGEPFTLVAFPGDVTRFEAPPLSAGRRLRSDGEAEVGAGLADALGLHPGAILAAQLPNGREVRFRVAGIVQALEDQGRVAFVHPARLLAADPSIPAQIAVRLLPGASSAPVTDALGRRGLPSTTSGGIAGQSVQRWAARSSGFIGILVALLRSVALINGAVCLYALAQALALIASERVRALAVIRSAGASRAQLAAIFASAAAFIALIAAPLGIVLERFAIGPAVSGLTASYVSLSLAAGRAEIGVTVAGVVLGVALVSLAVARSATSRPVVSGLREE